jgi:hypothetical protein
MLVFGYTHEQTQLALSMGYKKGGTDMKTLLFALRMALSQAMSCGNWSTR